MPSFTRKAIMQSFMKLVDQRPINKVTIKDIVEDCGSPFRAVLVLGAAHP